MNIDTVHSRHQHPAPAPAPAPRPGRRGRRAAALLLAVAPLVAVLTLPAGTAYAGVSGGARAHSHSKQDVYVTTAGHVELLKVTVGGSWSARDLTRAAGAAAVPKSTTLSYFDWPAKDTQSVVYIDQSGHVQELYNTLGSSTWAAADLTARAAAPAAPASAASVGWLWTAGGSKQVVYLDATGHVQELFTTTAQDWRHADLTAIAGAPAAAAQSGLTAYEWPSVKTNQVVYTTAAGDVEELSDVFGHAWSGADLTAVAHAAPAATTAPLSGYADGATKAVSFVATNGDLELLRVVRAGSWTVQDVSADVTAPARANGSAVVAYSWPGSIQIVYIGVGRNVEELSAPTANSNDWTASDLTAASGGAVLPGEINSIAAYNWADGNSKQVAYIDKSKHITELSVLPGQFWSSNDLTTLTAAPLAG